MFNKKIKTKMDKIIKKFEEKSNLEIIDSTALSYLNLYSNILKECLKKEKKIDKEENCLKISYEEFLKRNENLMIPNFENLESKSKILIITGCSKKKLKTRAQAYILYKGSTRTDINKLTREMEGIIDNYILSSGYGLVNAFWELEPYNNSLNDLKNEEDIQRYSKDYKVNENLEKLLKTNNYDYCFILLGKNYLKAFNDNFLKNIDINTKIIILKNENDDFIKDNERISYIYTPKDARSRFNSSVLNLKGKIIRTFLIEENYILKIFNPEDFNNFVKKYERIKI